MSQDLNDRTASRDPSLCAAYGCPMLGAMTQSTVGTSEWYCWLHFGKEAVQWQAITVELNHLRWLVESLAGMRRHYKGPGWPQAYLTALQAIRANQRTDLEKLQTETVAEWLRRLDSELGKAASQAAKPPVKQARMEQADTWQKLNFEVPEAA